MSTEVNKKLLAEVLKVYSVGSVTDMGGSVHLVFRQEEDDNSSWSEVSVSELAYLYKLWALEIKNIELSSWLTKEDGEYLGYCVSYEPSASFEDWLDSITGTSEQQAIRLMCESIYTKEK